MSSSARVIFLMDCADLLRRRSTWICAAIAVYLPVQLVAAAGYRITRRAGSVARLAAVKRVARSSSSSVSGDRSCGQFPMPGSRSAEAYRHHLESVARVDISSRRLLCAELDRGRAG